MAARQGTLTLWSGVLDPSRSTAKSWDPVNHMLKQSALDE